MGIDHYYDAPSAHQVRMGCKAAGSVKYQWIEWYLAVPWYTYACCSDKYWTNLTYLAAKGWQSLRYHNEKRVQLALDLAYEYHLAALNATGHKDRRLLAALLKARHNWYEITRPEFWVKREDAVGHGHDCGPFNIWERTHPPFVTESPSFKAAVADAFGGRTWEEWAAVERPIVDAVPGGEHSSRRTEKPSVDRLLTADGLWPSAWLAQFLTVYAPGWEKAAPAKAMTESAAAFLTTLPFPTMAAKLGLKLPLPGAAEHKAALSLQLFRQEQQRQRAKKAAAIAGGAVIGGALAAGLAFLL